MTSQQVRWFKDIGAADIASVGGKNASLGEMYSACPGRASACPMALP